MIRACKECGTPIKRTQASVCSWTCARLDLIKRNPGWASKNPKLQRFAFAHGLLIEDHDGRATIKNIYEYEDPDPRWQQDFEKIKARDTRTGKWVKFEYIWTRAARASHKRAAAKYLKRKGKSK